MKPRYLIDTSVLVRMHRSPAVTSVVAPLLSQGSLALCTPTLLESMFSTRASEFDRILRSYRLAMNVLPLTPQSSARAIEVQQLLAQTSQHRTAKVIDLLIAACAEVNDLTVLHYDRDYDAIAKVTGQPTMWVVPAGTVD